MFPGNTEVYNIYTLILHNIETHQLQSTTMTTDSIDTDLLNAAMVCQLS